MSFLDHWFESLERLTQKQKRRHLFINEAIAVSLRKLFYNHLVAYIEIFVLIFLLLCICCLPPDPGFSLDVFISKVLGVLHPQPF